MIFPENLGNNLMFVNLTYLISSIVFSVIFILRFFRP